MALKRSVLDRSDLYWPAPKLSGQASYGGVLKSVVLIGLGVGFSTTTITLFIMTLLTMFGASFVGKWMLLIPIFITTSIVILMMKWTRESRDCITIIYETYLLDRDGEDD